MSTVSITFYRILHPTDCPPRILYREVTDAFLLIDDIARCAASHGGLIRLGEIMYHLKFDETHDEGKYAAYDAGCNPLQTIIDSGKITMTVGKKADLFEIAVTCDTGDIRIIDLGFKRCRGFEVAKSFFVAPVAIAAAKK
jgi:hypothetical protein